MAYVLFGDCRWTDAEDSGRLSGPVDAEHGSAHRAANGNLYHGWNWADVFRHGIRAR